MSILDDSADDPATYDGKKPADEIESDIARTRANLSDTLDALEQKLAPRQLLERGMDMFRDSTNANEAVGRIGEALRENPLPVALIGAGLGWLLLSNTGLTRNPSVQRYARSMKHKASEAAGAVGDYAGGLAGRVRGRGTQGADYAHARTKSDAAYGSSAAAGYGLDAASDQPGVAQRAAGAVRDVAGRASEAAARTSEAARAARDYAGSAADEATRLGQRAWETAGDYAGTAAHGVHQARDRFAQIMEDYPIAVGALGFLAGAVIAATLPSTRVEDEWLGEARDDVWRQAEQTGRETLDRAQDIAATAAGAAADAAGEAAKDVIEKTKDAVQTELGQKADGETSATKSAGDNPAAEKNGDAKKNDPYSLQIGSLGDKPGSRKL